MGQRPAQRDSRKSTRPDGDPVAPADVAGRVVALMRLLMETPGGMLSVRAAAAETGISRSAVQRILARLAETGVASVDADGRYSPGPLCFEWASRLLGQASTMRAADRVMRELVDEFNENVYLTLLIPDELRISFVHVVECTQRIMYVVPLGSPGPLHAGAAGKAVLACLPPETLDRLDLEAYTPDTVTDPEALREDLEMIRERGYALSTGERIPDAAGVAAPFFLAGSVVGSITLTVPRSRLRAEEMTRFGERVSEKAQQLTRLIAGYSTFSGSTAMLV